MLDTCFLKLVDDFTVFFFSASLQSLKQRVVQVLEPDFLLWIVGCINTSVVIEKHLPAFFMVIVYHHFWLSFASSLFIIVVADVCMVLREWLDNLSDCTSKWWLVFLFFVSWRQIIFYLSCHHFFQSGFSNSIMLVLQLRFHKSHFGFFVSNTAWYLRWVGLWAVIVLFGCKNWSHLLLFLIELMQQKWSLNACFPHRNKVIEAC